MMKLRHNLDVPELEKLAVSDKVHRESYYTAHEMRRALSAQSDDEVNDKIQRSPFTTILADESTDTTSTK